MNITRHAATFLAGMVLYYVTVVQIGGLMSAIHVPPGYFTYFGHVHRGFALLLVSLLFWAFPVALAVTGGVLALGRFPRFWSWPAALGGMLVSHAYWLLKSALVLAALRQSDAWLVWPTASWWATPNFLAPWLGFACAVHLLRRRHPTIRPAHET